MFFEKYSALYTSSTNLDPKFIEIDNGLHNCFYGVYAFLANKFGKENNHYEIDIVRKRFVSKALNRSESIHITAQLSINRLYIVIRHDYMHKSDVLAYVNYKTCYDVDGKEYMVLNVQYSLFSSDSMIDEVINFVDDLSKRLRVDLANKEWKK